MNAVPVKDRIATFHRHHRYWFCSVCRNEEHVCGPIQDGDAWETVRPFLLRAFVLPFSPFEFCFALLHFKNPQGWLADYKCEIFEEFAECPPGIVAAQSVEYAVSTSTGRVSNTIVCVCVCASM